MAGFETGQESVIHCKYKVRDQSPWTQGDELKRDKIDATAIMKLFYWSKDQHSGSWKVQKSTLPVHDFQHGMVWYM